MLVTPLDAARLPGAHPRAGGDVHHSDGAIRTDTLPPPGSPTTRAGRW
ncbi:hypothetical protein GXW82_42220 [Streptacidiphilus sp. 4-A2]|nr:hypothetical protein [Streptacidiphilus sp. 4-A2]